MQDLFSVEGKVVLITGGSKGLGKMIAEAFVRSGSKVYITARHGAVVEQTAKELSKYGLCIGIENDISSKEGIDALVQEIENKEDFSKLCKKIYKIGYTRLLVESGLTFLNYLIKNKIINDLYIFKTNKSGKYNMDYLCSKHSFKIYN